jgi:hypothetical protein
MGLIRRPGNALSAILMPHNHIILILYKLFYPSTCLLTYLVSGFNYDTTIKSARSRSNIYM